MSLTESIATTPKGISMVKRLILALMGVFVVASLVAPTATAAVPNQPVLPEGARLVKVPENSPQAVPPGNYLVFDEYVYLRNALTRKCLGVAGGSGSNGAAIMQWTCDFAVGSDQRMHVYPRTGIWHAVDPFHSASKCLGVGGSSQAAGATLVQWSCSSSETDQQFAFRLINPSNLSRVDIFVRHSGQAIGVAGGSGNNGAPVMQWPWAGGTNRCTGDQCWDIVYD